MSDETTPHDGSLDSAAKQIASLFSVAPEKAAEDTQARTVQPEQSSPETETAEQAPAAPEGETSESEQATPPEGEAPEQPDAPPPPRTFKVKVDGQEVEVPEDELVKGYSRTADYTRKTQELAQQRREFEEKELSAVRAERQQYQTYLGQLKEAIEAAMPKEPDWQALRQSVSPDVFAAEWANWDQREKELSKIASEKTRVQALEAQDAEKGFQQYVQSEQAKLADAIPEFKHPEKSAALKRDLSEYAKSRGFTDEDLSKVTDHRLVVLLHDAMQGQKARESAKAKAPEIKNKIENALAPSQPGSRSNAPAKSKYADAKAKAAKTGKPEDAAAAIALLYQG